ncbi:MAG: exodeoxyribonuclease VII large subunit [Ruminococcus sp.]|nr:exodeoxyribonuclease VII large subunit [Ruminococcus sp.]
MVSKIITVSQLNYYIKSLFEQDDHLKFILVEGEISNLKDHYASGHIYFSLKDQKSVISAVMFSFYAKNLRFRPESGMKVIVRARVSVYEPSGQYQLYVEDMQPDGIGALTIRLEQLKKKLEKEGLFAAEHKKKIPDFPSTVGVITSPTGAAVRDIVNIISRRFPCAEIILAPVLVQGETAPEQLIRAVNLFSRYKCADVVIIGRGGGSIEDLWAFNNEDLARAIYDCELPVISAVGHETDFTICDFVADLRAPTPSAAAELAVPDRTTLKENLLATAQYIDSLLDNRLRNDRDSLKKQIELCLAHSPLTAVKSEEDTLEHLMIRTKNASDSVFQKSLKSLSESAAKTDALNPVAVLRRGFSYLSKDGERVSSAKDVEKGDVLNITLSDGEISAQVID